MESDDNTTLPDANARHVAAAAAASEGGTTCTSGTGAIAPEWPSLESLQRYEAEGNDIGWTWAVSAAVTALGRLVEPYVDIMATRISPDYTTIMMALKALASDGAVASFQAAWDELGSTPNGRAVIAVCHAATEDGAMLGRLYMTRTAAGSNLKLRLTHFYEGKEYLPALLAALEYYHDQTAKIAAAAASAPTKRAAPPADEWPSLESLKPVGSHGLSPEVWRIAWAPAVAAARRIITRFVPASVISFVTPNTDAVVSMLQDLGLDKDIPGFLAAWEELGSTRDGRAVIAVCKAASKEGMGLGERPYLATLAADRCLDRDLEELCGGKECLTVLQAAVRYYRNHEPAAAGGAGGAGTSGAGTAAAGGAEAASGGATAGWAPTLLQPNTGTGTGTN